MKTFALVIIISASISALAKENCTFTVDKDSVEVDWTAYKTTQKAPVPGIFKTRQLKGALSAKSLKKLLEGIAVTVDLASVDSKNPDRDKTLQEKFFHLLQVAPVTGQFKNVSEEKMTADLLLSLNGQQHSVPMTFEKADRTGDISAK